MVPILSAKAFLISSMVPATVAPGRKSAVHWFHLENPGPSDVAYQKIVRVGGGRTWAKAWRRDSRASSSVCVSWSGLVLAMRLSASVALSVSR